MCLTIGRYGIKIPRNFSILPKIVTNVHSGFTFYHFPLTLRLSNMHVSDPKMQNLNQNFTTFHTTLLDSTIIYQQSTPICGIDSISVIPLQLLKSTDNLLESTDFLPTADFGRFRNLLRSTFIYNDPLDNLPGIHCKFTIFHHHVSVATIHVYLQGSTCIYHDPLAKLPESTVNLPSPYVSPRIFTRITCRSTQLPDPRIFPSRIHVQVYLPLPQSACNYQNPLTVNYHIN